MDAKQFNLAEEIIKSIIREVGVGPFFDIVSSSFCDSEIIRTMDANVRNLDVLDDVLDQISDGLEMCSEAAAKTSV
jgi:hypothetical protein